MKNKRLVIVGCGYQRKKIFFEKAAELGLHIILIGPPGSWAEPLVDEYIPLDPRCSQSDALLAAKEALGASIKKEGPLDGITTFWEDDIILTALLAEELDLPYHSLQAAQIARDKFLLRSTMKAAGLPTPLFFLLKDQNDLEIALDKINRHRLETGVSPFPMVIKPARGAYATFTYKVENAQETREVFARIEKEMEKTADTIFIQGRELVIEEYLEGLEWDVDLVMQAGKVLYSSITDNWPTQEPYFVNTGSSLPSRALSSEAKQASIELAVLTVQTLGFSDGVLHIEGKYDLQKGPSILEINARPGGGYIVPWNLAVWGVDLAEMLFATALRLPIALKKSDSPRTYLEGKFFLAEKAGKLIEIQGLDEVKKMAGYKTLDVYRDYEKAPQVLLMEDLLFVCAEGATSQKACEHLEKMCEKIKVRIE